jgi:hypothetical protein
MNAPAQAGDHLIVEKPRRQPLTWRMAITGTLIFVLLIAGLHLPNLGPRIDHPAGLVQIGQYLCQGNQGLRAIQLRLRPDTYNFRCRDGALHADVTVRLIDPQTGS